MDVLAILDCCFAAATRSLTDRTCQVLAACGSNETARSVTTQLLGSILEAKPLHQGQKTRILGRGSQSCSHLYSTLPVPSHVLGVEASPFPKDSLRQQGSSCREFLQSPLLRSMTFTINSNGISLPMHRRLGLSTWGVQGPLPYRLEREGQACKECKRATATCACGVINCR